MNLNLTGHQLEITPALRDYVAARMSKLARHQVTDVNVVLSVEKLGQKAEASVRMQGKDIVAGTESADMYASIDNLADKLDRQIRKHKEKIRGAATMARPGQEPEQPQE